MARGLYHGHVLRVVAYLITNRILRILPPMHCDPDRMQRDGKMSISPRGVGQQDLLHAWLVDRRVLRFLFLALCQCQEVTGRQMHSP
jgi:hypothetical protein